MRRQKRDREKDEGSMAEGQRVNNEFMFFAVRSEQVKLPG